MHLCKCKKTSLHFPLFITYQKRKTIIMMLMNTSRECCGFISLASPSNNDTLGCSVWQPPIFSHVIENGTFYPSLAIPKELLSSCTITAFSWYLLTSELSRHILPHTFISHRLYQSTSIFSSNGHFMLSFFLNINKYWKS